MVKNKSEIALDKCKLIACHFLLQVKTIGTGELPYQDKFSQQIIYLRLFRISVSTGSKYLDIYKKGRVTKMALFICILHYRRQIMDQFYSKLSFLEILDHLP